MPHRNEHNNISSVYCYYLSDTQKANATGKKGFSVWSRHHVFFFSRTIQIALKAYIYICQSQWPRGLRRGSAATRPLRSWGRIPPGAWIFVCCECCVLSGRGLCNELITRPEESYRMRCIDLCDLETSWMRRPWPAGSYRAPKKYICVYIYIYIYICICVFVCVCMIVCKLLIWL